MKNSLIVDPTGAPVSSQKDVRDLTSKGAVVLSHFHVLAQHLGWAIQCTKCGQSVQGYNSGVETHLSVRCGCTEYRAEIAASDRRRLG